MAALLGALLLPFASRASAADVPPPALVARELSGLPARAATLLMVGADGGELPLEIHARPLPGGDAGTAVPFVVEIQGRALVGGEASPRMRVDLIAYALTEKREIKDHFAQLVWLDLDRLGARLYEGGLHLSGHLQLPEGRYFLRFMALIDGTARYGLRTLEVEVPSSIDRHPKLLAPLFSEPAAGWIHAAEAAPPEEGDTVRRMVDGEGRPGAALPLLVPETPATAELLALRPPLRGLSLRGQLADLEGRTVAQLEVGIEHREPTTEPGLQRFEVRFIPPSEPPGRYLLAFVGGDAEETVFVSPPQQVLLLPAASEIEVGEWSWARLQALSESPGPAPRQGLEAVEASDEVAAGYLGALRELAGGRREEALEAIARLEAAASSSGENDADKSLARSQLAVTVRLSKVEAESLVPVLVAHLELEERYRKARRFALASHARRMAVTLAGIYAKEVATPASRTLASNVYAVQGAELQEIQLWVAGRKFLERALELDPRNPFALLSLAVGHEKAWNNEAAVGYLRRLVEVDPKSSEGRLRLAVNLLRSGREDEGERLLRRLLDEDHPRWVLALAYQELARLAIDEARAGAAQSLRVGSARLGGQARLRLLLAYVLDRRGESAAADREIASILSLPAPTTESPRYRYNLRPPDDRDRIRAQLREDGAPRLGFLATALDEANEKRGRRRRR